MPGEGAHSTSAASVGHPPLDQRTKGWGIRTTQRMSRSFHMSGSTMAAWWGAGLSTTVAAVQVLNYIRDRAKIVMKVRRDMAIDRPAYRGMRLAILSATNTGRRPVTITGFALHYLYGKQQETDALLGDVHPPLPCEITEGRYVGAYVNQEGLDFAAIAYWYAWDSTGRHFRLNIAPWHKRLLSEFQWRRSRRARARATPL